MLVEVTDLQGAADDNKAQISGAKAYGNMDIVLQFDSEERSAIVLQFDTAGRSATYNCDGGIDVRDICSLDFHRIMYPLQLHLAVLVMKAHDGPVGGEHLSKCSKLSL